jgi:hypothetical protein
MGAKLPMDTLETVIDLATEGCKAIGTYIQEVNNRLFSTVPIRGRTCSNAFCYPHIIGTLDLVFTPSIPYFMTPDY